MKKHLILYLIFLFLILLISFTVVSQDNFSTHFHLLDRLLGQSSPWNPLLDERLPRLIILFCTGASLAVSGAIMQSLFQNPLASPSILGISAGGCLCVIVTFLMGWHFSHPFMISFAAVLGCCLTLLLVYTLTKFQQPMQISNLILTGIALSSLWMALQNWLLYYHREQWLLIQTISEWEAGMTTDRNWQHVHMQLPLTIIGLLLSLKYRKEMDILCLGEEEAANLGVEVKKVRWHLFMAVSLLTGGALAAVGTIAFFGLLFPHLLRYFRGSSHQDLIPLCLIGGGSTMMGLDFTLRYFNFHFISIGNLSAFLGSLFFIFFLFYSAQKREAAC